MSSARYASKILASVAVLSWLASCGAGDGVDTTPLVAKVYDRELHRSDLEGLVPAGLGEDDSLAVVKNYVDQWIRQSVLLAKAEKNVETDFSRELQEYKNSLLAYAYERQIVDQLLDSTVRFREINEYFASHKGDFLLKNSIVKAVYVVAPLKSPVVGRLKKIIEKPLFRDEEVMELQEVASRHGFNGYYDATAWIPFATLQASVPVTAYNEGLFLRQHRTITLRDDSLFYAARILDYKVSDDVMPLELARDNIRLIILNHRKIEILNNLQSDLLKEAEEGGHVVRKL